MHRSDCVASTEAAAATATHETYYCDTISAAAHLCCNTRKDVDVAEATIPTVTHGTYTLLVLMLHSMSRRLPKFGKGPFVLGCHRILMGRGFKKSALDFVSFQNQRIGGGTLCIIFCIM